MIFFNSTIFDLANSTTTEWVLTAKEILHSDPLNRNETELRELLTNVTNLEIEFGSSHGLVIDLLNIL